MKRIYCFINARGEGGRTDVLVEALCEDGDFLAAHRSSTAVSRMRASCSNARDRFHLRRTKLTPAFLEQGDSRVDRPRTPTVPRNLLSELRTSR